MENEFNDPNLATFMRLRKTVGFLGFLFPLILLATTYFFGEERILWGSISDYYFTRSGDIFVGIIFSIAFFLIAYKGYDAKDQWLTNSAGFFSILAALLPTSPPADLHDRIGILPESEARVIAHYVCAAIFFFLLAYISYFQFTKSRGIKTKEKEERNSVYRISAIVMVAVVVLIPVFVRIPGLPNSTFWLEWIALAAFGISWLTKGEFILADEPSNT
jgi:hypothetical protein